MRIVNWNKRKYTQEEFIQAWLNSKTIGEVAKKLGCDHRIENLRLLCPNCHSQTDTFAGKNKRN